MSHILMIDDNPDIRLFESAIEGMGHSFAHFNGLAAGLKYAERESIDIVLLKSRLILEDAIKALPLFISSPGEPEILVLADSVDFSEADNAIRAGAWDYLEYPPSKQAVNLLIYRVLQYRARKSPPGSNGNLKKKFTFNGVVGKNPKIQECFDQAVTAAASDANVLIIGETGTGKEVFAEAIHRNSSRRKKNFVVVDCAALPESLVESTLFGHVKGAFTGADSGQNGLVQQAHEGTLFLDEVGELPMLMQTSFLRVLETHSYRRVGGRREYSSNFRLVAATNRDLDERVKMAQFRNDLLFRIRAFEIRLPPLRERVEDLEELSRFQVKHLCDGYGIPEKSFSPDFFKVLARFDWPGNVRELTNALERAIVAAGDDSMLFPRHLPMYIRIKLAGESDAQKPARGDVGGAHDEYLAVLPSLKDAREKAMNDFEKNYLEELVSITEGDIQKARRLSGLSRSRLYALLKKHNVTMKN